MLEIHLLGELYVRLDHRRIELTSRTAQSLLALLALNGPLGLRREQLAEALWPEAADANARRNLRQALYHLRKAFEPFNFRLIHTDDATARLSLPRDAWIDAVVLQQPLPANAPLELLSQAVEVYGGELWPVLQDDWARMERARLAGLYERRMARLLDGLAAARRWAEAADWAERWIRYGNVPEPAYRVLMTAAAQRGDLSGVAVIFQRCREAMQRDLGVEPSDQTLTLFRQLTGQVGGPLPPLDPARWPLTTDATRGSGAMPPGDRAPYKGLEAFAETDAALFFGREAVVERLRAQVVSAPFLAVVGASGSGKSSVLRAGLLPALRQNAGGGQPGVGSEQPVWRTVVITPTARPLEALALGLAQVVEASTGVGQLIDDLRRDTRTLHLVARRLGSQGETGTWPDASPASLLLVVDQFEELFALGRDEAERQAFLDNWLYATRPDSGGWLKVVIALRADFYGHCAQYAELRDRLAANQVYLGPLEADGLRRAIEEPARRAGWELEAGLADVVLREAGAEPGALPLVSHALLETWNARDGRRLTLNGYLQSGGVRGAIARTADRVFAGLSGDQQVVARGILLRLTALGESAPDSRRRATVAELVPRTHGRAEVEAVLTALADARLLTIDADAVAVAHEALLGEWHRLQGWLRDERDGLRVHQHLTAAARAWQQREREASELYRGGRLAQALEWAGEHGEQLNALEHEFLEAARQMQAAEAAAREAQAQREIEAAHRMAEAERRRAREQAQAMHWLRRRAIYLVLSLVAAMVLAGAALAFGQQARQETQRAEAYARGVETAEAEARRQQIAAYAERNRAESQRLAAEANLLLQRQGSAELAALLAVHALRTQFSSQASAALQASARFDYGLALFDAPGPLHGVAITRDGGHILAAGDDHEAYWWDALTGETEQVLSGHSGKIWSAAVSPDGGYGLTGSQDATARLWDLSTGEMLREYAGHTDAVVSARFSEDGSLVITGSPDQTVRVWQAATGALLQVFETRSGVRDAALSPDGQYAAAGTDAHDVEVWGTTAGQRVRILSGHTNRVWSVDFAADGRSLLTGSLDKTARLWSLDTGIEVQRFAGHIDIVTMARFLPDGEHILTASRDTTVRLWDITTGAEQGTLAGHTGQVSAIAYAAEGQTLVSASTDGTARLWGPEAFQKRRELAGHTNWVWSAAIEPAGRYALTGGYDETARLWELATGRQVRQLAGHSGIVYSVSIAPNGSVAATGSGDGTVRLWQLATGRQIRRLAGHEGAVYSVAFSPDGRYLLSGGKDRTVRLWETATGEEVRRLTGLAAAVYGVAFSENGIYAVTGGQDGSVRLWAIDTGAVVREFAGHTEAVNGIAISPDGRWLASAGDDATVRLWEAGTGEEVRQFSGHTGPVNTVQFSPDGRYLLTSSVDHTARLWMVETGQEIEGYAGHIGSVWTAIFSPDGQYVLTGSEDNLARVWNTRYADLIEWVCGRVLRDLTEAEKRRFNITSSDAACRP